MGLWDQIGGSVRGFAAAEAPAIISAALARTNLGSLQGVVNQLQQGGLGAQVQSWLSSGPNISATPEELQAVLGDEQIKRIAAHFGVSTDEALKILAQHLPTAVDQASPTGQL